MHHHMLQVQGATLPQAHFPTRPIYCLSAGMVNFDDHPIPVRDARTCIFAAILRSLGSLFKPPMTVVAAKLWHTVNGLYM
jgi:hypothetical protein